MNESLLERLARTVSYRPHQFDWTLDVNPLIGELSRSARIFFVVANDGKGSELAVTDLYDPAWPDDPDVVRHFEQLAPESQLEVLTVYTVPLHETRHHLDVAATPFGARFFIGLALEYAQFQRLSPYLLQNQELVPRGGLNRLDAHLDALGVAIPDEWRPAWDRFARTLLSFEATNDFRGVDPAFVASRVADLGGEPLRMLGLEFRPLDVAGSLTLSPLDRPAWFMRSSTLLEGRAVIESLRWIISSLRGSSALRPALRTYVSGNFGLDSAYDYRCLLDLAAAWLKRPGIEACCESADLAQLDWVLHCLELAAWFGLHAPIRERNGAFSTESMFIRFAYAVQEMAVEYSRAEPREPLDLLRDIEVAERAQALHIASLAESLSGTRAAIDAARRDVSGLWQAGMRRHFDLVLDTVDDALGRREETGYASPLSSPPDGNPFAWFDPADGPLFNAYEPSPWVDAWFDFRNGAVFRPDTLRRVRKQLAEQFGLSELVFVCECGVLISAAVPRWAARHAVTCGVCGRTRTLDGRDLTIVHVPEELER
jgi:hypothetical protein